VAEAMKALDSLHLLARTDKMYVAFNTDLLTVLARNERLRSELVAEICDSWATAGRYIESRKHRAIWQNLYYQFGLMTQRLTEDALRQWVPRRRERLIRLCRTVCTAAQGQLYADEAAFNLNSEKDLDVYQRRYNGSHGPLRWFLVQTSTGPEELHVDIRYLDRILTNWLVGTYESGDGGHGTIQKAVLKQTFEIENLSYREAKKAAARLKKQIRRAVAGRGTAEYVGISDACAKLLQDISKWKWRLNDDAAAKTVYADLYNHARGRQTDAEPASVMLVVRAVEHHRRYTLNQMPSGEC